MDVSAAGPPDPVVNCSVSNQTHSSFVVACSPGFDGGLAQVFSLAVFPAEAEAAEAGLSILNMTSGVPRFRVDGLQSEKSFTLTVHSSNARGGSRGTRLAAATTRPLASLAAVPGPGLSLDQAKIGSLKTRLIISPVLGVLIGDNLTNTNTAVLGLEASYVLLSLTHPHYFLRLLFLFAGVGGAIILVSITLFTIMCCRYIYLYYLHIISKLSIISVLQTQVREVLPVSVRAAAGRGGGGPRRGGGPAQRGGALHRPHRQQPRPHPQRW